MNKDNNVTPEELALHECSHAVVVRLFKEYIKLERITAINNGLTQDEMLAANSIKGIHHEGSKSVTAMGMALVAGIIGDTIKKEGIKMVQQKKDQYLRQPAGLNWRLGGGDEKCFQTNVDHFVMMYQSDGVKYIRFCINLAIDFLTDPIVWNYIEQLSAALLSKANLALEEKELDAFFDETRFDTHMQSKKEVLMQRIANVEGECGTTDPYLNPGPDCS